MSWPDVVARRITRIMGTGYRWEAGFVPYRALVPMPCRGCDQLQGKGDIVWYVTMQGPFCTRCRNAALRDQGDSDDTEPTV